MNPKRILVVASLAALSGYAACQSAPYGAGWGFLYGYQGVDAPDFMPEMRRLGGGMSKVYLFWNQVEPSKGHYDWKAVDAYVGQLNSSDEGLISIFSSSTWATKKAFAILPPSPAKKLGDYYDFVYNLVKHCKGKVRFWQNDSEPNNPIYWAGTREEFVDQLKVFYRAVKAADPSAVVVCGGYDGLFNPPGTPPMPQQQVGLAFFDYVIKNASDAFDAFDLRLYADPYTIPARVSFFREKLGSDKQILCTEYGGPGLFEFVENRKYIPLIIKWSSALAAGTLTGAKSNPISDLYSNADTLSPKTRMFMRDCPPDMEAKYQRIQARSLVERNLLGFSAGVTKMLYWQFLQADGERDDLMTLMYGKIGMVAYDHGKPTKRYPVAAVFQRMAEELRGMTLVKQVAVEGRPTLFVFRVDRGSRGPLFVVWDRRDTFSGEDQALVSFKMDWKGEARATDLFGKDASAKVAGGKLTLSVGADPVYVSSAK